MRVSRHSNALMRRDAVGLAFEGRWRCARCWFSQEIKSVCLYPAIEKGMRITAASGVLRRMRYQALEGLDVNGRP